MSASGGNLFRRTLTNEVRKKEINKISRAKREGDVNKAYKKQNHMATAIEFNHVGKLIG